MSISEWITLGAVIVTLAVGIINLLSSIWTNKRTTFVNAVTSERVKWIGQLRELISEYLMLAAYYDEKPLLKGEELKKYFEKLTFLKYRIKLHLNQEGEMDQEINELIEKINKKLFDIYMARDILDIPSGNDKLIIALENYPTIREKYRIIWDKVIKEEKEIPQDKERFLELLNKVIYKLNNDLNKEFGTDAKDQLVNDTKWLVLLTGAYLKREWERVKNEAKKGKKAK